jgi:putative flippase GtrA
MLRQPLMFLLVGGLQYLLDAALFALLLSTGLAIPAANVIARASAATVGFLANRYLTFGKRADNTADFTSSLLRFIALWLVLTALSTGLMLLVSHFWGADIRTQVASKLMVEAVLAVLSFLFSKYWVFRQ